MKIGLGKCPQSVAATEWIGTFLDLETVASGGLKDWSVTFWGTSSTGTMLVSHVLYCTLKTLTRVLRNKALYKESKHPTESKKKLKIKNSKNYDLFLTMGVNYMEYTISSLTMWVWIACAHLCNSQEIYSLPSSQHDDRVLLTCQIQGLGVGIGKSGTCMIIWLKDFRFLVVFVLWTVHSKA